jgi:hypothetical protein
MIYELDFDRLGGDMTVIKGKEGFSIMVFYSGIKLYYIYVCLN